jgi:hypothetical protein
MRPQLQANDFPNGCKLNSHRPIRGSAILEKSRGRSFRAHEVLTERMIANLVGWVCLPAEINSLYAAGWSI